MCAQNTVVVIINNRLSRHELLHPLFSRTIECHCCGSHCTLVSMLHTCVQIGDVSSHTSPAATPASPKETYALGPAKTKLVKHGRANFALPESKQKPYLALHHASSQLKVCFAAVIPCSAVAAQKLCTRPRHCVAIIMSMLLAATQRCPCLTQVKECNGVRGPLLDPPICLHGPTLRLSPMALLQHQNASIGHMRAA